MWSECFAGRVDAKAEARQSEFFGGASAMARSTCRTISLPQVQICQPFPETGSGPIRMNASLAVLRFNTPGAGKSPVYCYVVDSIEDADRRYLQTGCSPNWQGGLITLCSCKHGMRTYRPDTKSWEGT